MSTPRQTGITTRQMQNAPRGALYIWPNNQFGYPRALAASIDRQDLEIVSVGSLRVESIKGKRIQGFVIDHAVRFFPLSRLEICEALKIATLHAPVEVVPQGITERAKILERGQTIIGGRRWGKTLAARIAAAKPVNDQAPSQA